MQSTTHPPTAPVEVTTPTPAPSRVRTWLRRIVGGGQIIETCPEWCTEGHEYDDSGHLDDLVHGSSETGVMLPGSDAPVLVARVQVDPYSEDPARNVPHALFWPLEGDDAATLDPGEFAAAIAQVRAHCDRLERVHARLVQARTEYPRPQ